MESSALERGESRCHGLRRLTATVQNHYMTANCTSSKALRYSDTFPKACLPAPHTFALRPDRR
jgi:hypothetical protein